MNMPEAIKVYVRVAELSSFTLAADQLGMPRASVSATLQQLEAHLGTRLLHRTTRRVEMTQDGKAFYERSLDMLVDMEELQGMFRQTPADLRGRLRVDMPQPVARDVVLPNLGSFLATHPGLEIELSSMDRRVDLVREGIDCVVRVGTLGDSSLIARPLGHYQMINCASPAYLAQHGTPLSLADLAHHQLIHYSNTLGSHPIGFEYIDAATGLPRQIDMPGRLTVNNTMAYEAAVLAGLGIVQTTAIGMQEYVEKGLLVEILPEYPAPPMLVSLLYANRRHLPRRVQVFMQWLAELLTPRLGA
ncbi:LysR family transcriptional regulator [Uliginosibacterium gangwonense]|uniref:LysR family transcriptional regulator n=1 Tax=Uliginosibacterium gangwonense TaxID=392736 RepID=UPI00037EE445|nr:LysR family transcriptional regulator [Uliginosibacterium gangwonense]